MTHPSNSTDTDYVDCFDIKAVAARIHAALFPEIPINAPIKTLADFEPLRAEQVQAQAATQPIPPQSPRRRERKPRRTTPDGLKTAAQAAAKLGCSIKTLNAHVDDGDLHYVSIGKGKKRQRKMFTDADLDEFVLAQTRKATPCPSAATRARRSGSTDSKSEIVSFSEVQRRRRSAKPKR